MARIAFPCCNLGRHPSWFVSRCSLLGNPFLLSALRREALIPFIGGERCQLR
jgi:hypothetical protein